MLAPHVFTVLYPVLRVCRCEKLFLALLSLPSIFLVVFPLISSTWCTASHIASWSCGVDLWLSGRKALVRPLRGFKPCCWPHARRTSDARSAHAKIDPCFPCQPSATLDHCTVESPRRCTLTKFDDCADGCDHPRSRRRHKLGQALNDPVFASGAYSFDLFSDGPSNYATIKLFTAGHSRITMGLLQLPRRAATQAEADICAERITAAVAFHRRHEAQ